MYTRLRSSSHAFMVLQRNRRVFPSASGMHRGRASTPADPLFEGVAEVPRTLDVEGAKGGALLRGRHGLDSRRGGRRGYLLAIRAGGKR